MVSIAHAFFESHVCAKLIKDGFEALTGKDGEWIQARTKGPGHGSVSRAFYARTSLVKKIFEIAS